MERFCLGIFAAVVVAIFIPALPSLPIVLLLACMCVACMLWRAYFSLGFLLFLLSLTAQVWLHSQAVATMLARSQSPLEGTVISIAQSYGDSYFFLLQVDAPASASPLQSTSSRVAVRWFDATARPLAGQRWRFTLKLKAVRGVSNPGSGNKEAAALVHGIVAQGTVQQATLLADSHDWRQQAFDLLHESTAKLPSNPILLALTVGERPFTPELWLALQSSGLSHLISISGMHIALVFGWILLLKPGLQYLPLSQLWRERLLWSFALGAAFAYCSLAGFAIPTWRALLAIVVITLLRMLLRRASGWRFSLVFTALLLLCWPTLMLSISFWLSVSAVALLFFMQWRFSTPERWGDKLRQFVLFQWLFTMMLLPISLLFFHGIAPLGFLCNLLFVPWISAVGIPALLLVFLLQLCWPMPLSNLWQLVDWLFRPLIWLFEQLAVAEYWWSLPELHNFALLFLMFAALIACLGRSRVALVMALMLSLPSLLHWLQTKPNSLHLVDVGQGSALILQQQDRALIYDVGPRYGDYSATKSHLLPYLRYLGIRHVDYLILSHNDSDHTGHWQLLQQAYPKLRLVTDIRDVGANLTCRQLPERWGDFKLQVLWSLQRRDPEVPLYVQPSGPLNLRQSAPQYLQQSAPDISKPDATFAWREPSPLVKPPTPNSQTLKPQIELPQTLLPQIIQPKNHDSCVVFVQSVATQRQWRLLLTGDADIAAERQIIIQHAKLRADVLVLGHHGSKTSSDLLFVKTLEPKVALNSAGYDNPYHHPSEQVKARLALLQIPLYTTADVGAIRLELTDEKLTMAFWRQQPWLAWVENVTDNAESPDLTR